MHDVILFLTNVNSPFRMLIEDYWDLISSIESIKLSLVRRYMNSVAHSIAQASGSLSGLYIWTTNVSNFLLNRLFFDHY